MSSLSGYPRVDGTGAWRHLHRSPTETVTVDLIAGMQVTHRFDDSGSLVDSTEAAPVSGALLFEIEALDAGLPEMNLIGTPVAPAGGSRRLPRLFISGHQEVLVTGSSAVQLNRMTNTQRSFSFDLRGVLVEAAAVSPATAQTHIQFAQARQSDGRSRVLS